jgi:hypothetical protein
MCFSRNPSCVDVRRTNFFLNRNRYRECYRVITSMVTVRKTNAVRQLDVCTESILVVSRIRLIYFNTRRNALDSSARNTSALARRDYNINSPLIINRPRVLRIQCSGASVLA